jgi:aldose 1-epimerase
MSLTVEREHWGRLSSGEAVDLYTLRDRGGLMAQVTSFGATLASLRVPDRRGSPIDVVLGFDELSAYERNDHYLGSTVGRYANRIRGGRLQLDAKRVQLTVNDGPNHLHGGSNGFSHRPWQAEAIREAGRVGVILRLRSADGDEGYPGNLDVEVSYWVEEGGRLAIAYRARTDAPTHINLTNHSYFNLRGSGDILDHRLQLQARRYTPIDATGIPTGALAEVAGTPMDFTAAKAIGRDIDDAFEQLRLAGGYDHNYVIDGWDGSLREFGRLEDPVSGRVMRVATTCPGVQLYSGNLLAGTPARGGGTYRAREGLCLETQFFPDTPNQTGFPPTRLAPGDVWRQETTFAFTAG